MATIQEQQVDWRSLLYSGVAECVFAPRAKYNGRKLLPELTEHIGKTITLTPLWLMDESDPYPGEWALGAWDHSLVLGRAWIASGDVQVIKIIPADSEVHAGWN